MKSTFISTLSGLMLTLFIVNDSLAQKTSMITLPDITVTSTTNVSKKVSDVFKATFKDAVNTQWSRLNKDFLVTFITGDLKNSVRFHKNGEMLYHIKYGGEKNLPEKVRKLIKSQYAYVDFSINQAFNVLEENRNIWVVNLEDNKKFMIVRVEDGELEEVSNLNKSLAAN